MAAPTPGEVRARVMLGIGLAFLEAAARGDDAWVARFIDPPASRERAAQGVLDSLGLKPSEAWRLARLGADAIDSDRTFVATDGIYLALRDGPIVARLAVRDLGARYRVELDPDLPLMTRLRTRLPSRSHVAVGGGAG